MTWTSLRSRMLLVFAALSVTAIAGCGSGDTEMPAASINPAGTGGTSTSQPDGSGGPVELTAMDATQDSPAQPAVNMFPKVVIRTTLGDIQVKLNREKSPKTVANFLENYVDRSFYSQTVFHHVEKEYMVAGGGYTADLQPKETRTPVRNESDNGLSNRRGTIAMVRHPEYADSATSQFFINLVDNPHLDQKENEEDEVNGYCVFGEVIDGMAVIDKIAGVAVKENSGFPMAPAQTVTITSVERIE